jgi:hypothetical protein
MTSIPTRLGTIVALNGYRYQITPTDVLWLARSVQYEGGNYLATAWTYAQRQVLYRRTGSLAELVLGHSQPVNPKWRRDGEFCRPGGRYHGSDRCSERSLDRRDEAANLPWASIRAEIRSIVVRWALGETTNPAPRATDFADSEVSASFLERHPESRVVLRDGNWYIAEVVGTKNAVAWPSGFVQILPPGAVATAATGASVLVPLAAAGAVWYFMRSRRGGLKAVAAPASTKRRRR